MKKAFCLVALLVTACIAKSQEIRWSDNIKTNPWTGGIIAKYQSKIITFNSEKKSANVTTSQLYVYDSAMVLEQKIPLSLPADLFGGRIFVYKDFFYDIYHIQHKDT